MHSYTLKFKDPKIEYKYTQQTNIFTVKVVQRVYTAYFFYLVSKLIVILSKEDDTSNLLTQLIALFIEISLALINIISSFFIKKPIQYINSVVMYLIILCHLFWMDKEIENDDEITIDFLERFSFGLCVGIVITFLNMGSSYIVK